tara:strand:- start:559 stop:1266 length:708 start_codon:yes stop_codon:yes gene_type:complete
VGRRGERRPQDHVRRAQEGAGREQGRELGESHRARSPFPKRTAARPKSDLGPSIPPTRARQSPNDAQERTGLDGAKVRRAVTLECQAAGDETPVDFDEFHALACRRGGPSDDGFVDPVLATQMYMETHKLVPLLESMTAAVMTAKPDDPAKFLEQKLRDHHFRGAPVLGYDEKDLDAVFHQFDIVRSGAITQEQCDKAIIAMTGHKAKPRTDPGAPVTKAEFMRLAREALDEYTA